MIRDFWRTSKKKHVEQHEIILLYINNNNVVITTGYKCLNAQYIKSEYVYICSVPFH